MAETHPDDHDHPTVDPSRARSGNPFDHEEGAFGQSYSREREEEMGRETPSGHPLGGASAAVPAAGVDRGVNVPDDNGRRGSFDARTGEVRGSGAGAGGGDGGEDFDEGTADGATEAPTAGASPDRRG
jgi:hypothetical protein